jgi:hypothetical protein
MKWVDVRKNLHAGILAPVTSLPMWRRAPIPSGFDFGLPESHEAVFVFHNSNANTGYSLDTYVILCVGICLLAVTVEVRLARPLFWGQRGEGIFTGRSSGLQTPCKQRFFSG